MFGLRSPFVPRGIRSVLLLPVVAVLLTLVWARPARAQGCPLLPAGGGAASRTLGRAIGGRVASSGGRVRAASAPCNTPPSIMVTPAGSTLTYASPLMMIEYCSPNYGIDMASNRVTLNGRVIDATNGDTTVPLLSQNPDTLPSSGFCGAIPKSGMTAEETGRVRLRPGADTLVAYICDDVAHCSTRTVVYSYTPTWPFAVTPHDSLMRVFSSRADTAQFLVHRLDADTTRGTYALTCTATGGAVPSCATPGSITLAGGQSTMVPVVFTGGPNPSAGRVTLRATLTTNSGMTDAGSDSVIASLSGVAVGPHGVALNAAVNAHNTAFFTVTNTGPIGATYTLQGSCTGADTACVVSASSQTIAAGATVPITVGYKSEALGSTGGVTLRATHVSIPSATDLGSYTTTAMTPSAMVAADASAGATLERALCLTVAAGHGAASECGELRLVHGLPSIRTKNKSRTPTLLYTSALAHPEPLIPLTLTLPAGMPVPDSVTATVTINATVRATGKWTGTDWGYAPTRRVVLGFDALSDSTGFYPWTAQASSWYGATRYPTGTLTGQLAIVNRSRSNFGAGWWLAGLEKLYALADGSKLWIGGDGSVRHFLLVPGLSNVWYTTLLDHTDGLNFDGTYYSHVLPHGLRVVFDATGRHVKTINRMQDTTSFFYTGQRLDSLQVPPTALAKRYVFTYDAATPNRIVSVIAPPLPARSRITTITTSGGRLTAIRDPDSTVVSFGYTPGDTNRITSRTDRRSTVGTFSYNAAKLLVRDSIDMGTTGAPIVTNFRPGESMGWGPLSVDTATSYGLIDGPRADVSDTTLVWLDKYHEPRRIRNALGQDTRLTRGNASYPALVTRLEAPNGRVLLATYDGHGNLATSTDSATCLLGTCATTAYAWDQTWDFVKKVTAPLGEVTLASYDPTFGNKRWQQPDADSTITSRRVTFGYDAASHLVDSVQEPLISAPQRMWYDAAGNLDSVKTPTGIPTRFYLDAIGRDTLVKSAIDYGDTTWVMAATSYDVADQDILSRTFSFPLRADSATVLHGKMFDAEGNVLRDSVKAVPDTNHIGWVKHLWTYDNANRKLTEFPQGPSYGSESFAYDPAGNLVRWVPRSAVAITTTYDALNRTTERVVPALGTGGLLRYTYGASFLADTIRYTYDVAGHILSANNVFAHIARAYNLNGTLAADTERVRESDSASTAFSHVYGLGYGYDLEGRRLWMKHPGTLATGGADSVAYSYDATTGLLRSVRDPSGYWFTFAYDAALRLASDTALAGTTNAILETRSYDNESRTVGRHETQGGATLVQDTLTFDARNKEIAATFRMPDATTQTDSNRFAKLGAMTKNIMLSVWNDDYVTDALGHQRSRTNNFPPVTVTTSLYDPLGSAELDTVVAVRLGNLRDSTKNGYDIAGALRSSAILHEIASSGIGHPTPYFARQRVSNRYGGNLQLMASQTQFDTVNGFGGVFPPATYFEREEYRYDALGRRIWRRLVRPSPMCSRMHPASGCLSIVERTVWDGDQVLWEIRADGGDGTPSADMEVDRVGVRTAPALEGLVFYTHGAGIDHPLSIGRSGGVIIPQYDWRGNATTGYCVGTTICGDLQWPEQLQSPWAEDPQPGNANGAPIAWAGNLIDTKKDGSGYIYMRNRYYDPRSGRFTQMDPIGLAGGLNAYGFAGGDPVNFSDPFGLCPDPKDPKCDRVYFFGITGSAILGAGATGGAGVIIWSGEGPGVYARGGGGFGGDVGAAGEAGTSTNLPALTGESNEAGAGFVAGGSVATNKWGNTFTATLGPKASLPLPPLTEHVAHTYTGAVTCHCKQQILQAVETFLSKFSVIPSI